MFSLIRSWPVPSLCQSILWWQRLLFLASISFAPAAFAEEVLQLVTENDPPLSFEQDGLAAGEITDVLRKSFANLNLPFHSEVWSWPRAIEAAKSKPNYCVYGTARTKEREADFKWVGPIAVMDWMIYAKKGMHHPKQISDLKNESIGGCRDDAISLWLIQHGYKVDLASEDVHNPAKLLIGRFNYWASSRTRGDAILSSQHLGNQLAPIIQFGSSKLYLACNKHVPDTTISKLNRVVRLFAHNTPVPH
ncbi:transporter substrate-binding domain-containing protein [Leeia sp. TBRC 13508]|uniref:Transporter substrate-binding domain-containing protein n=1 Tax=Leeia speluncae TaxID=2884804 RepID=A0ABS8D7J1_9NEIS|nr:transporter substrate-binding domain-containing protein [Leeia speluncae]MCB6184131.1 transporter substrate-binding domain-containing protein [Leeia speluncae]